MKLNGLNERKRTHSDSDSKDNEAPVAKPVKVAKIKIVQKSFSKFFSNGESSSSVLPAASSSILEGEQAAKFNIDCVIEAYRFGHTKFHCKRHTILCSSLFSKPLSEFKKSMSQLYGVEHDARRANIGSYEICRYLRTYSRWKSSGLHSKDRGGMAEFCHPAKKLHCSYTSICC